MRKTKIVATLGPATDQLETLTQLIKAGVNVVRLNFSHGAPEDHIKRAEMVRTISADLNIQVAILGDLQGPKIRISTFCDDKVELQLGDNFTLDADMQKGQGNQGCVGIDYKELARDVAEGDLLLLDDGRIQLRVESLDGNKIHTKVVVAGVLSNNKGINKKGGGLSAPALTDKDKKDIIVAAQIQVDFLAVSFPRCGDDLRYARSLAADAGLDAMIVAKVERAETVNDPVVMDELLLAADVIMVARGNLGVEIGDAALMGAQKRLIYRACELNRPVITATQMMESMICAPMPTRAEVMDVANAVLDGTDAVMLSAETAAGKYPIETVKAVAEVCLGAEQQMGATSIRELLPTRFEAVNQSMAISAVNIANSLDTIKAVVSLTASGQTSKIMSRLHTNVPVLALSDSKRTLQRLALFRGISAQYFNLSELRDEDLISGIKNSVKDQLKLAEGDQFVLTLGSNLGEIGSTDVCQVITLS